MRWWCLIWLSTLVQAQKITGSFSKLDREEDVSSLNMELKTTDVALRNVLRTNRDNTITGDIEIDGNIIVSGLTASSMTVLGTTTVSNLIIQNPLTLNQSTTFNRAVVINSSFTLNGTMFPTNLNPCPGFASCGVSITSTAANTMLYSMNVTSVTEITTGEFVVTYSTPFVHDGYGFLTTPNQLGYCGSTQKLVRHTKLTCEDNAGTQFTPSQLTFMVFGVLNP